MLTNSIVICTYRRTAELRKCLLMLVRQSRLPVEVIVVDNDSLGAARVVVEELRDLFRESQVLLLWEHNQNMNSLTAARNLGVRKASGSIVTFVDDDVELDVAYLEQILHVFEDSAAAMGVQGMMQGLIPNRLGNLINKIFFEFHYADNARVLPSVAATYPASLEKIDSCEWLSGSNQSYRRVVFEVLQFDEALVKYSEGEDLDFSVRVFRRFPNSLRITPLARLWHLPSQNARLPQEELVLMREVYGLYLHYKLFGGSLACRLQFLWSRIGRVVICLLRCFYSLNLVPLKECRLLLFGYRFCWIHRASIRAGDLTFYNNQFQSGRGAP